MNNKLTLSFFLMGLSLGFGPCLSSCGPLLISYIAGTQKGILKSSIAYILFSLSRVSVYLVLGLLVFLFGQLASRPIYGYFLKYSFILGGIFIIIIGLLMAFGKNLDTFGGAQTPPFRAGKDCSALSINPERTPDKIRPKSRRIDFKFCRRLEGVFLKKDKKTILIFGLIIGIMPCLPLVSVLYYIGLVSKNFIDSLLYSFSFGLGTVISPLFVLSALSGFIPVILMKHKKFFSIFNSICGLIIVVLGVRLIITGFR